MKRFDLSLPEDAEGSPREGTSLAALKRLLAEYNIGLSFGLSPQTGQRVMRLVDERTGSPRESLPVDVRHRLAGVVAQIAAESKS